MNQIFRLEVRENRTEISAGKISLRKAKKKKKKKNRYSRNFRQIFIKLSENVFLAFSRQCPDLRKYPSNISADARGFVEKSDF